MIINREFFFRGWLPAGLLINARLLTDAPKGTATPVLKPIINPIPGAGWPTHQPAPTFPVEQATSDTAIVLADPLPEGSIALTITPDWTGDGTPYILAVNTWYEGRIRSISGEDVMGVRLMPSAYEDYYSYYSAGSSKDVRVYNMPCRHMLGRGSEQVLLVDPQLKAVDELGYPAQVSTHGEDLLARVVNLLQTNSVSFAGMTSVYKETNPGTETHVILCSIEDGRRPNAPITKVALAIAPKAGRQKFYSISDGHVINEVVDVVRTGGTFATVARSKSYMGADQVVHYN